MRSDATIARSTLSKDMLKRIIDAAAVKGVAALSFTGGEPLLYLDDLEELITYAGQAGIPLIRTGTNGFMFRSSDQPDFTDRMHRLAERLASIPLRNFWISLDSAYPAIHETMRGLKNVIAGIEKALPIFHDHGLFPSANLGINRCLAGKRTQQLVEDQLDHSGNYLAEFYNTYRDAFDQYYHFIKELGFTIVNACYPMSISAHEQSMGLSAVYAATATEDIVRFTTQEKVVLYDALLDAIYKHRRHIRIFSPTSALYMLAQQYRDPQAIPGAFGCRGGIDFFFISASDGNTYPCGYRGHENLGKFWNLDVSSISHQSDCHRCDWECFRDPSEMSAPLLQAIHHPLRLIRRLCKDPIYIKHWIQDLRYYRACELFDGRKPPQAERLSHF